MFSNGGDHGFNHIGDVTRALGQTLKEQGRAGTENQSKALCLGLAPRKRLEGRELDRRRSGVLSPVQKSNTKP